MATGPSMKYRKTLPANALVAVGSNITCTILKSCGGNVGKANPEHYRECEPPHVKEAEQNGKKNNGHYSKNKSNESKQKSDCSADHIQCKRLTHGAEIESFTGIRIRNLSPWRKHCSNEKGKREYFDKSPKISEVRT